MGTTKALARLASFLEWLGFLSIVFGVLGSAYTAVIFVRAETGFAWERADECCSRLGVMALGAVLGSMFFVLIGAILLLLSRLFDQARINEPKTTPRWLRWVPPGLFFYGVCIFALTAVLASNANQLGEAAGGIVTFCVFSFVGLMLVASGIRHTAQVAERQRPPVS